MPPWIVPACAVGSFALALVVAILKLSERFFATKDALAKLEKETAESHQKLHEAMTEKVSCVKTEAADKLAKAVEDRRKDVAAVDAMLRADHKEKMEAIEDRLLSAIKESKEDRKAGETLLFQKIDNLTTMVLRPRTGETHAIPRELLR